MRDGNQRMLMEQRRLRDAAGKARVFTLDGRLHGRQNDAEMVHVITSHLDYGVGPFGLQTGRMNRLRADVLAGRLLLPGRSSEESLSIVSAAIESAEGFIKDELLSRRRSTNKLLAYCFILVILLAGLVFSVLGLLHGVDSVSLPLPGDVSGVSGVGWSSRGAQ